jgi:hypothetical protein
MSGWLAEVRRTWKSEAFWFGFWEGLSMRAVFDPRGHRERFFAMLKRSRSKAKP